MVAWSRAAGGFWDTAYFHVVALIRVSWSSTAAGPFRPSGRGPRPRPRYVLHTLLGFCAYRVHVLPTKGSRCGRPPKKALTQPGETGEIR
jgi:hypothetical protein